MHFYRLPRETQTRLLGWWRVRTQPAPKKVKINHTAFKSDKPQAAALLAKVIK